MTLQNLILPPSATGGIITIGNFDGVHRGHQSMLSVVSEVARQRGVPAVVVTFDPHPITILKPHVRLPRLSTIPLRTELLRHYGADHVVVLPVTSQLLGMSPQAFFQDIVVGRFHASGMVEGPDFRFGKNRAGDTGLLRQLCSGAGMELTVIDAVCQAGQMLSSSRIRILLEAGQVRDAVEILGHPHTVTGTVSTGAGRGRELGFPTANLDGVEVLLPSDGVYAGRLLMNGQRHGVAISIGPNPTFGDESRKVECHVIGFNGDLYGQTLSIDIVSEIRPLRPFASKEALIEQISADVETCQQMISRAP